MRGTDVLIEALADLAMTPPVSPPLQAIATQPKIVDGDRHMGER
jgi:hypothetical protein